MFKGKRIFLIVGLLLITLAILAACQSEPEEVEVTRVVEVPVEVEVPGETVEVEVEVTRVVEVPAEVEMAVAVVPFEEEWANSPHNNAEDEAFVHWDEDGEIQESCAKCHSTPGYLDFIGADGSEEGVVNAPAPLGTTVECEACHNDVTVDMTSVVMPSGVELMGLGDESRCMQCHQGRHSTVSVNASIEEAGLAGEENLDNIGEDIGFSNIHYYAAAATQYGTLAMGGYEYDGKSYDSKFEHVEGYDTCISCHNAHTLEVEFDDCTQCHEGLNSSDDLVNIRMAGSLVDYNGNGDMEEGIYAEIEGLREMLYQAMQAYAEEVSGTPLVYAENYPYFFDDAEERYASWTPRLAKAAYNYQVSLKDPGRYAHGGKYIIQLLYDSIEDLNVAIAEPVDLSTAHRIDHGHFAGSEEAFRHWDEDDPAVVPGRCSRCHSAAGLPLYLEQGVSINQHPSNGFNCATCHNDLNEYTLYASDEVEFPSGAVLSLAVDENDEEGLVSNLCMNCHQGRSSTNTVNDRIGDTEDDTVSDELGFVNIHYFAAGATLLGNEAMGAYEYEGQEYVGRNEHVGQFDSCVECHDTHALTVVVEDCADCHEGVEGPETLVNIRESEVDYDGDDDVEEGIDGEIQTMADAILVAMQAYAEATEGVDPIVYDSHSYPYFFIDTNGDGLPDPDEANYGNRYATWTPRLLQAAYNYQYAQKDPGAYAHNGAYVLQALYDTLNDIGGDVSTMTRP